MKEKRDVVHFFGALCAAMLAADSAYSLWLYSLAEKHQYSVTLDVNVIGEFWFEVVMLAAFLVVGTITAFVFLRRMARDPKKTLLEERNPPGQV